VCLQFFILRRRYGGCARTCGCVPRTVSTGHAASRTTRLAAGPISLVVSPSWFTTAATHLLTLLPDDRGRSPTWMPPPSMWRMAPTSPSIASSQTTRRPWQTSQRARSVIRLTSSADQEPLPCQTGGARESPQFALDGGIRSLVAELGTSAPAEPWVCLCRRNTTGVLALTDFRAELACPGAEGGAQTLPGAAAFGPRCARQTAPTRRHHLAHRPARIRRRGACARRSPRRNRDGAASLVAMRAEGDEAVTGVSCHIKWYRPCRYGKAGAHESTTRRRPRVEAARKG
jgi:hypothetical protein